MTAYAASQLLHGYTGVLVQSQRKVHVLDGLRRCSFQQVVDAGHERQPPGFRVIREAADGYAVVEGSIHAHVGHLLLSGQHLDEPLVAVEGGVGLADGRGCDCGEGSGRGTGLGQQVAGDREGDSLEERSHVGHEGDGLAAVVPHLPLVDVIHEGVRQDVVAARADSDE